MNNTCTNGNLKRLQDTQLSDTRYYFEIRMTSEEKSFEVKHKMLRFPFSVTEAAG